jgi:hypothetical protein
MKSAMFGLAVLALSATAAAAQHRPPVGPTTAPAPVGACEIRPDAPYVNPRLPLGRAAYARRPACRTTWAPGPSGPGLYVQGPPIEIQGPPVHIGGLMIYLVPPEIVVQASEVTMEPPEVHSAEAPKPEDETPDPED